MEKISRIIELNSNENIKNSLNKFTDYVVIANAVLYKNSKISNSIIRNFSLTFSPIYFLIFKEEAQKLTNEFYCNPKEEIAIKV